MSYNQSQSGNEAKERIFLHSIIARFKTLISKILQFQPQFPAQFRSNPAIGGSERSEPARSESVTAYRMDLSELLAIFGPGISGAVFGAGWWFWVDAVVCSSVQVPFVHYLPGICVCARIMPSKLRVLFEVNLLIIGYFCRDFRFFVCFDVQLREERGYRLLAV